VVKEEKLSEEEPTSDSIGVNRRKAVRTSVYLGKIKLTK
jgi:hypothetical protein